MSEAVRTALVVADAREVSDAIATRLGADLRVAVCDRVPWPDLGRDDLPTAAQSLEAYWQDTVRAFVRDHGRLDVLVTVLPAAAPVRLHDADLAAFHRRQLQHLVHPWLGLKHAGAAMKPTGGALIVVGDLAPAHGDVFRGTAARALANMMQAMALECAGSQPVIRVNWVEAQTMRRQTAQVAEAVRLLASPRASFMTGTNIVLSQVPHDA